MEPESRPGFRAETVAAIGAVRAALALVQARQGAEDVHEKSAFDLVTATDVLSQQTIERRLREALPDIAFVGEEGDAAEPSTASRHWLVDPICGTTNFAVGLPLYAINVALVEDGEVTCAVVADGALGDIFVAERGHGAWRLDSGGAMRIHASPTSGLLSVDPHARGTDALSRFAVAFAQAAIAETGWDVRIVSTTLALAYVASGRMAAAVYSNLGSPVHFAAGLRLAEEAGALVTDAAGDAWSLDSDIVVVAADAAMQAGVLRLARSLYGAIRSPNP